MSASDGVNGTVCNAQQYSQFIQSSANGANPTISCLSHGESIGLALTSEASFLSCVAVIFILARIVWNIRWYKKNHRDGDWTLFQGPTDIYMFSLFVFDFFQAMGGVFDLRWAHNGIVTTGHYCTTQGIVQQIGELGVALITLLLAIHTFVAALWQVGLEARGVAWGLVGSACVFVTLWVSVGASIHKNYEMPSPYWCWISSHYSRERLAGEYIWLWVALFASVFLYPPLYFWAKGRLSIPKGRWWWPTLQESKSNQGIEYEQRRAALAMLFYPIAYSVIVLPLSVTRWLQFSKFNNHHHVPSAATFFGVILFNLSGAINVLLFLIFKPGLLLFPRPDQLRQPDHELVSVGNGSKIFMDTTNFQHSPEPTTMVLAADSEGARLSRVNSKRSVDEV